MKGVFATLQRFGWSKVVGVGLLAYAGWRYMGRVGPSSFDPGTPGNPPACPATIAPDSRTFKDSKGKQQFVKVKIRLCQTAAQKARNLYEGNPHLWPQSKADVVNTIRLVAQRFDIPEGVIARIIQRESGSNFRLMGAINSKSSAWAAGGCTIDTAHTCKISWFSLYWWPRAIWCIAEVLRRYGYNTKGAEHALMRYRGTTSSDYVQSVLDARWTSADDIIKWVPLNRFAEWEGGKKYPWWLDRPSMAPFRDGTAISVKG